MNKEWLKQATKLASRNYNVILSHDKLSDGSKIYLARNPELPGCKAQGLTPTDAINNLREARTDYIYFLIEDGVDVPIPNVQANITSSQLVAPKTVQFKTIVNIEDVIDAIIRPDEREDLLETWSTSEPVRD